MRGKVHWNSAHFVQYNTTGWNAKSWGGKNKRMQGPRMAALRTRRVVANAITVIIVSVWYEKVLLAWCCVPTRDTVANWHAGAFFAKNACNSRQILRATS